MTGISTTGIDWVCPSCHQQISFLMTPDQMAKCVCTCGAPVTFVIGGVVDPADPRMSDAASARDAVHLDIETANELFELLRTAVIRYPMDGDKRAEQAISRAAEIVREAIEKSAPAAPAAEAGTYIGRDVAISDEMSRDDAQEFLDDVETWVRDYEYYVPAPDPGFSRMMAVLKDALKAAPAAPAAEAGTGGME